MQEQILKWKAEHVDFLRLLDLLELQISLFHEGTTPNYDLMLDIVYYLTHFPDTFHIPGRMWRWVSSVNATPQSEP